MTQPDFRIESQPPCPAIVFKFSQSLPEEIARFDSKGFYYKGEFIDDAGEVHRLLKQVLEGQLNIATPPPEPPTDDFLKSYPEVTRVEVITNKGREFVRYECSTVQVSFQDDGQTIKVFLFSTYD